LRWLSPGRGGALPPWQRSDRKGQLGERVGNAGGGRYVGPKIVVALSELLRRRLIQGGDLLFLILGNASRPPWEAGLRGRLVPQPMFGVSLGDRNLAADPGAGGGTVALAEVPA